MPVPNWENLDDFFDANDFAVIITIQLQAGGQLIIPGIFNDPYVNAELGNFDMDSNQPTVVCKEADVVSVRVKDIVIVDTKTYDILSNPEADGTGLAILRLAEN